MRIDECGRSVEGLTNSDRSVLETKCFAPACRFLSIIAQHRRGVHKVAKEYRRTSVRKRVDMMLASTRKHADSLPPLKYLDGLVHLRKPTESLGFAALRDGTLQFRDSVMEQRAKMQVKVVR
jgi:hypothetical protein